MATDPHPHDPLAQAKEVAEAATPGPWDEYNANEGDDHGPLWAVANDAFHNPPAEDDGSWFAVEIHTGHENDATFIATFDPETVTALLDAVQAAKNTLPWHPRCSFSVSSFHDDDDRSPCGTLAERWVWSTSGTWELACHRHSAPYSPDRVRRLEIIHPEAVIARERVEALLSK